MEEINHARILVQSWQALSHLSKNNFITDSEADKIKVRIRIYHKKYNVDSSLISKEMLAL